MFSPVSTPTFSPSAVPSLARVSTPMFSPAPISAPVSTPMFSPAPVSTPSVYNINSVF
jgi:hypothetical protein